MSEELARIRAEYSIVIVSIIVSIYLIKTLGATMTRWHRIFKPSVSMEIKTKEKSEAATQYNTIQYNTTQSLGYDMIEISESTMKWMKFLFSCYCSFFMESLNDKYTVTVSLDS